MKTITIIVSLALAASMPVLAAETKKTDKTLGEKTTETLSKVGEKTKDAGRSIVNGTKKAADAVVDAVTPDKDARRIDVTLNEKHIDMPKALNPGKTAFVVRNSASEKRNFGIEGQGIDKKFMTGLAPGETKVLHVDLKSGSYKADSILPGGNEGARLNLNVK